MSLKNIVIIGGGFSGTVAAINLIRLSSTPLQIAIIDKSPAACRGVAYGTRNLSHLLNVVARNMSALADQPNHFVEWLATRSEFLDEPNAALRERFAPRRIYGDYLHNLFQWTAATIAPGKGIQVEHVPDEAIDILLEDEGALVALQSGRKIAADKVILAAGNQAPSPFPLRGLDVKNPKYIGNPWIGWEKQLPGPDQEVLMIGTGLTMVDTFLTLQDLGWRGKMTAVSRNGLLPLSHYKGFDYPDYLAEETGALSLRRMISIVKKQVRETQARHLHPAIVVDKLRPHTQRLWQNFSLTEKRRFNRHLRTRWNVVRHRIAPEIHAQLTEAVAQGRLEIIKGRLAECGELGDHLSIAVGTAAGRRTLNVGAVINCTGPRESYLPATAGLFKQLIAQGTVQPDELNMGLKVGTNGAVIGADGVESDTIYALGGLLKGTLWESTAVPELRSQTFRLAEAITAQLAETGAQKVAIEEVLEDVMEYSI